MGKVPGTGGDPPGGPARRQAHRTAGENEQENLIRVKNQHCDHQRIWADRKQNF